VDEQGDQYTMKIKDLLNKVMTEGLDKLTDEERQTLDQYQDIDYEKLANDRAAKARREMEDKLAKESKAREELAAQLKSLQEAKDKDEHSKLSDLEKMQAKLAQLEKNFNEAQSAREQAEQANHQLIRSTKLDKVFSNIPLVDGVDPDTVRTSLDSRLKEVDLDDQEMVQLKVQEFMQRNKAIIRAPSASGGGSSGGSGGGSGGRQQDVDLDALVTAAASGDIEATEKMLNEASFAAASGKAKFRNA
jgi:ATPase subunit of ABC transporter with duplicated ATPase domains